MYFRFSISIAIFFAFFFISPEIKAQTFYKAWGGSSTFEAGEAITLYDGDIILGGTKNDSAFVMRITTAGSLVWLKRFKSAASTRDYVVYLNNTSDGYIIGTGFTTNSHDNSGFYFKMDGAGNFSFLKGSSGMYYFRSIYERTPNEYVAFGAATDVSTGTDVDLKIFSINKTSGNIISQTQRMDIVSSGFSFTDDMESAIVIDSNNIYSTGRIYLAIGNNMRPHLIKYDRNNNVKWSKFMHGPFTPTRRCYPHGLLYQSPNTFYIPYFSDISCSGACNNYFPGLIKVDTSGNVIFDKTYDVIGSNGELVRGIVSDGLYLYIVGFTNYNSGSRDIFVLKLDTNGNLVKARSFGTSAISEQFMISFITPVVTDSSYIYITGGRGTTTSSDLFVMKIDTSLNMACGTNIISCNLQSVPPSSITNTINLLPDVATVANRTSQTSHIFNESMPCTTPSSISDTLSFSGSQVLDASYPGASYQWSTGEITSSITVSAVGNYSCLVTVGCCSFYHYFVVQVCTFSPLSIASSPINCPGDTLELNLTGDYSFTTTFHSIIYTGNDIFVVPDTGNNVFSIHATNTPGCGKDTIFNFYLSPPDSITFIEPTSFCTGDSVTIQVTGDYSFTWAEGSSVYSGSSIHILVDTSHTFNVSGINDNGCVVDSIYNFAVNTCSASNWNDTVYIGDTSIVLNGYDSSATGYNWSTGDSSSSITVSTVGTYSCTVSINCCSYIHTFTVVYCSGMPISISQNNPHCFGDVLNVTLSGPYTDYYWTDGTVNFTGNSHIFSTPGTYNYTITADIDGSCPVDTAISASFQLQDSIIINGPSSFCYNDTININVTGNYSFTWNDGTNVYPGSSVSVLANEDYYFILNGIDSNGCFITGSYALSVTPPVPIDFSYFPDNTPCINTPIELFVSGPYSYIWTNGSSSTTGNTVTFVADTSYQYTVIGIDPAGCTMVDTTIAIHPLNYPSPTFIKDSINDCDRRIYYFLAQSQSGTYQWNINSIPFTNHTQSISTALPIGYNLVQLVVDNNGCIDSSQMVLFVDTVGLSQYQEIIPNVFTPNGDGINDFFKVTITGVSEFSITIFDRWGIEVYHSIDPNFRWNGLFKDDKIVTGMYLYLIHYSSTCSSNTGPKEIKGWLNVSK